MGGANGDRVSFLEWGVSVGTLPGQERSGDAYVVRRHPDGGATVAVVDGLGHGPDAAAAAARAAAILADGSPQSVIGMARRCHDALARTRGAVMNIATFSTADDTMSWLGIGNVEGVLMRASFRLCTSLRSAMRSAKREVAKAMAGARSLRSTGLTRYPITPAVMARSISSGSE